MTKLKAYIACHIQAASYSIKLFYRRPIANLVTVIVIAVALTLPALFWVTTDNISHFTSSWKRNGHISLYLKPTLSVAQTEEVLAKVRTTQSVAVATLKSAQQGLAELTSQEGMADIMHYLPENPLPAVIEVVPSVAIDSPAKIDLLARQLRFIAQVDNAKVDMEWIGRLHTLISFANKLSNSLLALLALAVVLIISNTLRLTVQNRYEEIQVLKLIGAKDAYIIRPFLYSGVWYGFAGAVVAVLLVNLFILSLGMVINQLAVVYQMHYPIIGLSLRQILLLIIFAIILGWLGACVSVKRQLTSIEPAL